MVKLSMRLTINVFKAALAVSCLAIAACGGNSSADSQSSPNSKATVASVLKAAVPGTASPNGTTIPSATQITDSSGNVWTVSGGVIFENGALAGYSKSVTLLLYDNNIIYQENSAGGWWSWKGSTWVSSSDPRNSSSPNGTAIPSVTQITDGSGNVWTVSGGVIFENGTLAGYSNGVTRLLYDNNIIYQENSAGGWWSWKGSTWVSSSDPSITATTGSASLSWTTPTQNTNGTPLTDLAGYTIYYGTSPSELTQTIQLADPSATSYVINNLSAGTYYFAVAAYTTVATQSAQSSVGSKTIL
jgi:Fibronectin type III domain